MLAALNFNILADRITSCDGTGLIDKEFGSSVESAGREGSVVAIFEQFAYVIYEFVEGSWKRIGQNIEAFAADSADLATLMPWKIGQSPALSDDGETIAIPNIVKVYRLRNGTEWDEIETG